MSPSLPSVVVFDLDGTLVDSRPDLATAVNRMRAELGLEELPEAAVGAMIGEGAKILVERGLADAPMVSSLQQLERLKRAQQSFLAHYAMVCTVATRPYDGVEELLRAAAQRWPLALLTNKPIAMTRILLEHLGWGRTFREVVGGDSLPFRKPDGRGLRWIAAALGAEPSSVVLVGDSRIDAETASAAGARFIWVEWGYAAGEDRRALAGGESVATPAALIARLGALLAPGCPAQ